MQNSINVLELIPRCHNAAKAKGFWDVKPNFGQQLMLASGELGECQEADRKHRRHRFDSKLLNAWILMFDADPEFAKNKVEKWVKDTVQDELADTYIRLCDFIGGFDIPMPTQKEFDEARREMDHEIPDNFGEALMQINYSICSAYRVMKEVLNFVVAGEELAAALLGMEFIAKREGIDLAAQIELKLLYNATRERLHGKAY